MSFDQLAAHASDIKYLAIKHAMENDETDPEYARNGLDGYYQLLVDPLFAPYVDLPDPVGYQPMIDDLSAVLHDLSSGRTDQDPIDKDPYLANPVLDKMHTASDYLQDWTGQAAMTFKQKFLDPFPSIASNQFILSAILKAALEAHQAMWASARTDIDNIAHATIAAFDNKCCDKNKWNLGFTVLSSVGAVGAAILTVVTEGAAAPLALQVIGAAAQVGATLPPSGLPDPPTQPGQTALQITSAMRTGIEGLTDAIRYTEGEIAKRLRAITALVREQGGYFVAPRPALAGTEPGEITGDHGLGDSD